MNPPHFHLLILPLARLSPAPALALWSVANLAALLASLRVITRTLGLTWTLRTAALTATGMLVCAATGTILVTGQLTFLLMWPLTVAWSLARRNDWTRAGVLLGAVVSIKPFLGLFAIYLLVTGRVRALVGFAAAFTGCFALGLLVFGVGAHASWLRALSSVAWLWSPMNASIGGLFARAFSSSPFYRPLIEAPELVTAGFGVASIGVAAVTLWALVRDHSREAIDRAFAGLFITSLVVSPLGWIYYLWFATGPAVALWRMRAQRLSAWRRRFLWLAVPGLFCPLIVLVSPGSRWPGITLGSLYGWSLLCLWAAFGADWFARKRAIA